MGNGSFCMTQKQNTTVSIVKIQSLRLKQAQMSKSKVKTVLIYFLISTELPVIIFFPLKQALNQTLQTLWFLQILMAADSSKVHKLLASDMDFAP